MWSPPWTGGSLGFGPRAEHATVRRPEDLNLFFHDAYGNRIDAGTEFFAALALDAKYQPLFLKVLAEGGKSEVTFYKRDILAVGNVPGARWFVFMHNHPSGKTDPSPDDVFLTETIRRILAEETPARLWDHIITTANRDHFSFRQNWFL